MVLVLSAFGAFFSVQVVKLVWPKTMPPLAKMLLALGLAILITYFALPKHHTTAELVIYGVASAGIAIAVHRLVRLAILAGDFLFVKVTTASRRIAR